MNSMVSIGKLQSSIPTETRCHPPSPTATLTLRRPSNTLLMLPTKRFSSIIVNARGFGVTENTSDTIATNKKDTSNKKDGDNDEIPQEVFYRIIKRILVFVGAPMSTGLALLYFMSFLKEQQIWDVPLWLPFVSILLSFGTSALGIAYGTLSSSWEADKEGSLLGWEQAQKNWPELWKDEEKNDQT